MLYFLFFCCSQTRTGCILPSRNFYCYYTTNALIYSWCTHTDQTVVHSYRMNIVRASGVKAKKSNKWEVPKLILCHWLTNGRLARIAVIILRVQKWCVPNKCTGSTWDRPWSQVHFLKVSVSFGNRPHFYLLWSRSQAKRTLNFISRPVKNTGPGVSLNFRCNVRWFIS